MKTPSKKQTPKTSDKPYLLIGLDYTTPYTEDDVAVFTRFRLWRSSDFPKQAGLSRRHVLQVIERKVDPHPLLLQALSIVKVGA